MSAAPAFWTRKVKSAAKSWWRKVTRKPLSCAQTPSRKPKIREAEGEATAIRAVQRAFADSLVMLNEAAPERPRYFTQGLEAFAKAADGKATKIIIPSKFSLWPEWPPP